MRTPLTRLTMALVLMSCGASVTIADEQAAKAIIEKAIDAMGGQRQVRSQKTPMLWMERGTYYGMGDGIAYVAQYAAKWPNWYRQEIEGQFAITVNGDQSWVSSANGQQRLSGEILQARLKHARLAWAVRLFPLLEKSYTLAVVPGVAVDNKPTVGIQANHKDGGEFKFYFDKETFRLVKTEAMVLTPEYGKDPVLSETFYTGRKSAGAEKFKVLYNKKLFLEGETVDYKIPFNHNI